MPRPSSPLALEYILLAILDEHPYHGYELFRELNSIKGIRLIWNLKQSMLYALLDKLEAEELISGRVITDEARPSRREYTLTAKGQQAAREWIQSPVKHGREMRQEFLGRLYFANRKSKETALALVELQKKECQSWLVELMQQKGTLSGTGEYEFFVVSFRISQVQAMLDWLESSKTELRLVK